MLNFRRLKQEISPNTLKEGKLLFDKGMIQSAKIINYSPHQVRVSCRIQGGFDRYYSPEIEIDQKESLIVDSDCDCPSNFDCQHIAGVLYYLEEHFDSILVAYSQESDLEKQLEEKEVDEEVKHTLRETIKEAQTKEVVKKSKKSQKELLEEYIGSSNVLGQSPFFIPEEKLVEDKAEMAIVFSLQPQQNPTFVDFQLALRLPYRSKPLYIPNIKEFLDSVRYQEPLYIGSKRFFFSLDSFDARTKEILKRMMEAARFYTESSDRGQRSAILDLELFGSILADVHQSISQNSKTSKNHSGADDEQTYSPLPGFYYGSLEEALRYSAIPAGLKVDIEYLETPAPKILLNPQILLEGQTVKTLEEIRLFECASPGMINESVYYRFEAPIKRKHLRNLNALREVTIPEPLFGTFVENSIPALSRFALLTNKEVLERFVTLPFTGDLKAECNISYLNNELEAELYFIYDKIKVPVCPSKLKIDDAVRFATAQGILARNLTEEQKIAQDLFQDFVFDPSQGAYVSKNDKKIVEFMTEVVPRNQGRVKFNCPENLLEQFVYDNTHFTLNLSDSGKIDSYEVDLKVDGPLLGVSVEQLWDCLSYKRSFIELTSKKNGRKKGSNESSKPNKILVLDLEKLTPIVQLFDEMGISELTSAKELRPLWSLASLDPEQFKALPVTFTFTPRLKEIQKQILGEGNFNASPLPEEIQASLRSYQIEGVSWLERLRTMHLSGILADDMGLGKTLQAIIAVTQNKLINPKQISVVVCPTSLVYNWKEEFNKFNPKLRVLPIDGTPGQRKKLLSEISKYDVVITSYSLLQKDIEFYEKLPFSYAILDEAQHIKNRGTRNAKSVKMIQAAHRLILTGTPIENSLDELWSLFDFLMPGLLSSYERFVEKYIRTAVPGSHKNQEALKRKVSPFILRRMKKDVLEDLPAISEIVYHCHLTETQKKYYQSYAESAREELSMLVDKEGFDKIQIHVLATLTRLKQICCHPAIFAKDSVESGDSAKYEMLMELLHSLMEGGHKTVIFSQYTRMLNILREDLVRLGIRFQYLDGSSKNRLDIVKEFNEDKDIPIFLVSLKAGGTGLNLVGADTVIHYDMWWNPAVESQATDRVHRLGQKNSVSSYKLVTLGTIEEKILDLHNRKKGLVKKVISCDDEAIARLTWEEVLELLQT